jgi:hypothetical protein
MSVLDPAVSGLASALDPAVSGVVSVLDPAVSGVASVLDPPVLTPCEYRTRPPDVRGLGAARAGDRLRCEELPFAAEASATAVDNRATGKGELTLERQFDAGAQRGCQPHPGSEHWRAAHTGIAYGPKRLNERERVGLRCWAEEAKLSAACRVSSR